jgi:hypothetical protein
MNYQKIYDSIIERAKIENREKNDSVYYEAHHILPICLGGTGNVKQYKWHENLVLLTAREHFVCHWLLHELHPENKELTKAFCMMCILENSKQTRYRPSSRIIEYAKIKNREARKKQIGYWEGKNLSDETKQKLRISQLGKKQTEETITKRFKNRHVWGTYEESICPHCGKSGSLNLMKRWHFDNCSIKTGIKFVGKPLTVEHIEKLKGPRGPQKNKRIKNK